MMKEFKEVMANPNIYFDFNENKQELHITVQPYDNSFELFEDEYEVVKSIYDVKEDILDYYQIDVFSLLLCYTWLDGLRETNSLLLHKGAVLSDDYDSKKI